MSDRNLFTHENMKHATALIRMEWAEKGMQVRYVYWRRGPLRMAAKVVYVSPYEEGEIERWLDEAEMMYFLKRAAQETAKAE